MVSVLRFISETFDLNVLILFLLSSIILLGFDARYYKKNNAVREYKSARFFGYFYIAAGILLYVIARNIRL